MGNILVIGSSGHAHSVLSLLFDKQSEHIVGLIDDFVTVGTEVLGCRVLGKVDDVKRIIPAHNVDSCVVAVGDNYQRYKLAHKIQSDFPEISFPTIIHSKAAIGACSTIGSGTVVMAQASIGANCSVGSFCILNTGALIDHDSILNDYASLAPGVVAGGNVCVGAYSAVGIGATLIHRVAVGKDTVIGAGSTVLQSIGDEVVAFGTPATVVRRRTRGEKYL